MRHAILAFALLASSGCGEDHYNLDGGDLVTVGEREVALRGCPTCHQSSRLATDLGGWADIQIVRAIRYGVDNEGEPLCPTMPRFTELTDLEADAIVAYLRSLPPVARHDLPESVCARPDLAVPAPAILDGGASD